MARPDSAIDKISYLRTDLSQSFSDFLGLDDKAWNGAALEVEAEFNRAAANGQITAELTSEAVNGCLFLFSDENTFVIERSFSDSKQSLEDVSAIIRCCKAEKRFMTFAYVYKGHFTSIVIDTNDGSIISTNSLYGRKKSEDDFTAYLQKDIRENIAPHLEGRFGKPFYFKAVTDTLKIEQGQDNLCNLLTVVNSVIIIMILRNAPVEEVKRTLQKITGFRVDGSSYERIIINLQESFNFFHLVKENFNSIEFVQDNLKRSAAITGSSGYESFRKTIMEEKIGTLFSLEKIAGSSQYPHANLHSLKPFEDCTVSSFLKMHSDQSEAFRALQDLINKILNPDTVSEQKANLQKRFMMASLLHRELMRIAPQNEHRQLLDKEDPNIFGYEDLASLLNEKNFYKTNDADLDKKIEDLIRKTKPLKEKAIVSSQSLQDPFIQLQLQFITALSSAMADPALQNLKRITSNVEITGLKINPKALLYAALLQNTPQQLSDGSASFYIDKADKNAIFLGLVKFEEDPAVILAYAIGQKIDITDPIEGVTPLHHAIAAQNYAVALGIINAIQIKKHEDKQRLSQKDTYGNTALSLLLTQEYNKNIDELLKALVQKVTIQSLAKKLDELIEDRHNRYRKSFISTILEEILTVYSKATKPQAKQTIYTTLSGSRQRLISIIGEGELLDKYDALLAKLTPDTDSQPQRFAAPAAMLSPTIHVFTQLQTLSTTPAPSSKEGAPSATPPDSKTTPAAAAPKPDSLTTEPASKSAPTPATSAPAPAKPTTPAKPFPKSGQEGHHLRIDHLEIKTKGLTEPNTEIFRKFWSSTSCEGSFVFTEAYDRPGKKILPEGPSKEYAALTIDRFDAMYQKTISNQTTSALTDFEKSHIWIQTFFPTREPSTLMPTNALLLNDNLIAWFKGNEAAQNNFRVVFDKMMLLYGLEVARDLRGNFASIEQIAKDPSTRFINLGVYKFLPPSYLDKDHDDSGNHNYARLSRIITSCAQLGFAKEACALAELLHNLDVYNKLGENTKKSWGKARDEANKALRGPATHSSAPLPSSQGPAASSDGAAAAEEPVHPFPGQLSTERLEERFSKLGQSAAGVHSADRRLPSRSTTTVQPAPTPTATAPTPAPAIRDTISPQSIFELLNNIKPLPKGVEQKEITVKGDKKIYFLLKPLNETVNFRIYKDRISSFQTSAPTILTKVEIGDANFNAMKAALSKIDLDLGGASRLKTAADEIAK